LVEERIETALRHLKYSLSIRETRSAIIPFRKYYAGYLKGLPNNKEIRQELYQQLEYAPIEEILYRYMEQVKNHEKLEQSK
jgi:tRNA-dihydrouridine synthase